MSVESEARVQAPGAHSVVMQRFRAAMLQGAVPVQPTTPLFKSVFESTLARTSPVAATHPLRLLSPASLKLPSAVPVQPSGTPRRSIPGTVRPVLQADTAEYASIDEARRWGGSSCSAAALTAVLRGAGSTARVGDVVRTLEKAGGITVARGLVSRPALVATAREYGLAATDRAMSYEQLAGATQAGPVLVDITNARFPAGHWLVVTGVDSGGVSVVDSSGYRSTHLTRAEFQAAWSGRGIVVSSAGAAATTPQEVGHA